MNEKVDVEVSKLGPSYVLACINEPFLLIRVQQVSIIMVVIASTPDEYDVRRCVGSF